MVVNAISRKESPRLLVEIINREQQESGVSVPRGALFGRYNILSGDHDCLPMIEVFQTEGEWVPERQRTPR